MFLLYALFLSIPTGDVVTFPLDIIRVTGYPTTTINVSIMVSTYDPQAGGVNCNGDCTSTASGRKTITMYHDAYCYVAAPPDIPMNTAITFRGTHYIVADRGGRVERRRPGDEEPAANWQNPHIKPIVQIEYIWLDFYEKEGCTDFNEGYGVLVGVGDY